MTTKMMDRAKCWVKRVLPLYIFTFLPFLCACDHVAEDERLIEIGGTPDEPMTIVRNVLLEDYTGQRCSNCPNGTAVIEQMQEAYGDRLVAVSVHSGPFGKTATGRLLPLTTEAGCEYYDHWQVQAQPGAQVNRRGTIYYKTEEWMKAVQDEQALPTTVKMEARAGVEADHVVITLDVEAVAYYSGTLQVWLLENGITAIQTMPDGSNNREYIHNHVLRAAVNGTWGESLTVAEKGELHKTLEMPLSADWNVGQLSVVAFVYNEQGVEQAVKCAVEVNQ